MRKRIHRFALLLVALTLALPICAQAVGEGDGWGAGAIHVPKNFKFSKLVNHGKGGVPPVATGTKGRKARQGKSGAEGTAAFRVLRQCTGRLHGTDVL